MDIVIKNIGSAKDVKFFSELAKRLGLKISPLTASEKEEIAMGEMIREGMKSGFVEEKEVIKTLRKIQGRK